MKRVLNFSQNILQILLLFFLVLAVITGITSKFNVEGLRSYVVLSGSMQPAIPVASVVYVFPQTEYNIGDIIAFKNKAGLTITHRIIAKGSNFFLVAGDANNTADSDPVPYSTVVGRVIFHLPFFGRASTFIRTPVGFCLAIALPALIFIVWQMWQVKSEIEKDTEKRVLAKHGLAN